MKRGGNKGNYQTGFYQEYTEQQVKPVTHGAIVPDTTEVKPVRPLVQPGGVRLKGYIRGALSGLLRFLLFLFLSLIISAALTLLLNEPLRGSVAELLQNLF